MSAFWLCLAGFGLCLVVLSILAFFVGICVNLWRNGERLGAVCLFALVFGLLAFAVGGGFWSSWEDLP